MKTLQQQCYQYALKLLSKRAYSCKRLLQKLQLKFTQILKLQALQSNTEAIEIDLKPICQQCIDKLLEKNYLNDEDYAQMLLRNYAKYGQNRLKQLLNQHGLQAYMHLLIQESNDENQELDKALFSLERKFTQKLYQIKDSNIETIDIDIDIDEHEIDVQINQNKNKSKKETQTKIQTDIQNALKFQQKCIRFLVQQGFNYTIAMQAFKNFVKTKVD